MMKVLRSNLCTTEVIFLILWRLWEKCECGTTESKWLWTRCCHDLCQEVITTAGTQTALPLAISKAGG